MGNIKVSVITATYNQEEYIAHAIESVLMQKVDFEYELIVGDDCSSDRTAEIVSDFASKHPNTIVPVIRKKNLGMTGNVMDLIFKAKGEYIAFIEGDDYWLDESKLQKQVDYLDTHPEYIAVFGRCIIVDEKEIRHPEVERWSGFLAEGRDYTIKDFQEYTLPGQTATSMYRKVSYEELGKRIEQVKIPKDQMIDRMLVLLMLSLGKMYVMDEELAAYRRMMSAESGSWSSKNDYYSIDNIVKYLNGMKTMELVAEQLGLSLDFDERRVYELNKLYDNRGGFSKEDFLKLRKEIGQGFLTKMKYYKYRIKKDLLKK